MPRNLDWPLSTLPSPSADPNTGEPAGMREPFAAIVRSSLDGIMAIDLAGRVQVWNPAMERLTGLASGQCMGLTVPEVTARMDAPELERSLWRALAGERVDAARHRVTRPDGSELTLERDFAPMYEEGGAVEGALCVVRDVSEQQHLEDQLLQAQKIEAVGQLAGGIAHDFNNLLTVILGYCELAQLRVAPGGEVLADLTEIRRAAERATALTRQLLAFSRKQVLQPEAIDVNSEVREVEQMLGRLIGEDVRLTTALAPDVGTVVVDRSQLHQVLINLAVNSRDAMPQGGRLVIETRNAELDEHYAHVHPGSRPGAYVMIAVSDTGTGMDAAVTSRIFEPFFTTKERGKGTGLGLSMVYGVVKQSGGSIWVYSELGHGTTFKIYLPRVDVPVDLRADESQAAQQLDGSETVLVAEDDDVVRGLVVRLLRLRGYLVIEAPSGRAAMLADEEAKVVHLLVTDVVMPDMSGRQLADRLQARHPELPVLFISGYTDESIASRGVLDPGLHLLEKPFTAEALARRVREILDLGSQ